MDPFNAIKSRININGIVSRYHVPPNRSGMVVCPFHDDKTPSLSVNDKDNYFNCFGCGVGGDGIAFVANIKGLSQIDAAKLINADFGLGLDFKSKPENPTARKIREHIKDCQTHVGETDFFLKRGLTEETQKLFGLGYNAKKKTVVIPYSSELDYYIERGTKDKRFYKPPTKEAGSEPVWNVRALKKSNKEPVFVVESPICAMTIKQYGGEAVAIGGTGTNKLLEAVKLHKTKSTLVLCLDNDEAGEKVTNSLEIELPKIGAKVLVSNIASSYKDPNELAMRNPDKLVQKIDIAKREAQALSRERGDLISFAELSKLRLAPVVWLIVGFLTLGLNMLTAASKMGKTWLCLQICDAISRGGTFLEMECNQHDVLYYALEDNDQRLQSRLHKMFGEDKISENAYIVQDCKKLNDGLTDELAGYLDKNPKIKLVIIDPFQMIRGPKLPNEKEYAYDYRELSILRKFANERQISILLVHHSRKMKDESDVFNMTTGSTGLLGATNNMYFIYKAQRMSDGQNTLSFTGHDVIQGEKEIIRCPDTCAWKLGISKEEKAKMFAESEYYYNPVVMTIKHLLASNPDGWKGTISEFRHNAMELMGRDPYGELNQWGLEINKVKFQLSTRDNISHVKKRSALGQLHSFFPSEQGFVLSD